MHSTFWQLLKVEFQHIGVKYMDTDLIRNSRLIYDRVEPRKKINLKKLNNSKRKKIS